MTDRRPGPPLFELLNKDQPDPEDRHDSENESAPQKTQESTQETRTVTASVEHQEERAAQRSAGVSRAERSAATMPEETHQGEGGIVLSMPRVYLLIALGAVVMVLVWAIAYKAGVADGKREMETLIPNDQLVLPPTGILENQSSSRVSTEGAVDDSNVGEPPRVPARPAQALMTAQGYTEADPRVSGNNYLQLATLSTEQAADAVLFMNDNGISIIGVPVVDSSVRAGNNPSRYTLYSIGLAVPGGSQFGAMESQRREHKRAIANLGERWQRERRGGSDFAESKTQWVKYN
jgi:hypothetical protein